MRKLSKDKLQPNLWQGNQIARKREAPLGCFAFEGHVFVATRCVYSEVIPSPARMAARGQIGAFAKGPIAPFCRLHKGQGCAKNDLSL